MPSSVPDWMSDMPSSVPDWMNGSGSEARLHPHQRAHQLTHLPGTQRGSEPAAPRPAGISSYSSGAWKRFPERFKDPELRRQSTMQLPRAVRRPASAGKSTDQSDSAKPIREPHPSVALAAPDTRRGPMPNIFFRMLETRRTINYAYSDYNMNNIDD